MKQTKGHTLKGTCRAFAALLLVFFVLPFVASGLTSEIDLLLKEVANLDQQHSDLQSEIKNKSKRLDALGKKIDDLKQKQDLGLLEKYRLSNLLADSLNQSNELDKLEVKLKTVARQTSDLHARIVDECETEILGITDKIKTSSSKKQQEKLVREYFTYREIKIKHQPRETTSDIQILEFPSAELDSPEELLEKAAFVRDFRKKIENAVEQIDKRIRRLKSDLRLSQEMNQFIAEQSLFDEGRIWPEGQPKAVNIVKPDDDDAISDDDDDASSGEEELELISRPLDISMDLYKGVDPNLSLEHQIRKLKKEKEFLENAIAQLKQQEEELTLKAKKLLQEESR